MNYMICALKTISKNQHMRLSYLKLIYLKKNKKNITNVKVFTTDCLTTMNIDVVSAYKENIKRMSSSCNG